MIIKYKDWTPQIDETSYIATGAVVAGDVKIGKNSSVWHNVVLRGDMAPIVIGDNTNIQDNCVVHCIEGVETRIGDSVTVGHGAILHSCIVDDGSLIGMGSILLDGVKIGRNCLVGAGALISPNTVVPDGSLILGSPGRVIRKLTEDQIGAMQKGSSEYIRLAGDYKSTV